ncbi:hypothetical protein Sru01_16750 [Sphaerisporangium rufum]|uniref:Transposase IS4-like domain-containing protein n=1 Tax=Sphaerisporangium rufum TaxID=1381558 RepID=A0A919V0H1_9ACTN|nr:hypothetical protein Sru01_16750 [Sphaerisporangium rufum]
MSEIAAGVPAWQRYSAGEGAKGRRLYAWAWKRIDTDRPGHRWLLIRRNLTTGEPAFYRCFARTPKPLAALVKVAGTRWTIEETFQAAKGQVGLDHYQVRGWTGWHRHITLATLALAFLAVAAATCTPDPDDKQLPLTVPEIRRLLAALTFPALQPIHTILRWSWWRRRHHTEPTTSADHSHDLKVSLEYWANVSPLRRRTSTSSACRAGLSRRQVEPIAIRWRRITPAR